MRVTCIGSRGRQEHFDSAVRSADANPVRVPPCEYPVSTTGVPREYPGSTPGVPREYSAVCSHDANPVRARAPVCAYVRARACTHRHVYTYTLTHISIHICIPYIDSTIH